MAIYSIPIKFVDEAAYFDRPVTLLGRTYLFTMRYNTRSENWTCDLADANGQILVAGFALSTGRNLLAPYYVNAAVPRGVLIVEDLTGANTAPTLTSFASTHRLSFYYNG